MPPRAWKVLPAVAILLAAAPASAANHAELKALVEGPWRHVPPISQQQQGQDQARCRFAATQTFVDSTTPAIIEMVRWSAQINCLQALGYVPGSAPTKSQFTATASNLVEIAGLDYALSPCALITKARKNPIMETSLLVWARGYLEGWNEAHREDDVLHFKADALSAEQQKRFLWQFCDRNPEKYYLAAVMDVAVRLKKASIGQPFND